MFTIVAVAAVFVVFLLSIGVFAWFKMWPTYGDVPLLRTPAWEFRDTGTEGVQTMLRRESPRGGALLLKRTDLDTVYRYEPETRSLKAVTNAEWQNATGSIWGCLAPEPMDNYGLRRDYHSYKLFAGEREIPTAGGIAMDERISPSGRWVAVHSAAGPAMQAIIPGGYLAFGQRYHEIMSVPDFVRRGEPVRIPVDAYNTYLHPCWSPDEKLVIYTSSTLGLLVVVETGL